MARSPNNQFTMFLCLWLFIGYMCTLYMYVCMHVCIYAWVFGMYLCMYIYMCVWIYVCMRAQISTRWLQQKSHCILKPDVLSMGYRYIWCRLLSYYKWGTGIWYLVDSKVMYVWATSEKNEIPSFIWQCEITFLTMHKLRTSGMLIWSKENTEIKKMLINVSSGKSLPMYRPSTTETSVVTISHEWLIVD